jgi:hypothetical protein
MGVSLGKELTRIDHHGNIFCNSGDAVETWGRAPRTWTVAGGRWINVGVRMHK